MTGHRQFKVMIEIKEIPLVPSQLRKIHPVAGGHV